jgi:NADH-quinone oxidoreductase subunit L
MSRATVVTGTLLLVFGVVAKSAQFPLHSWLPDAMAGPAPVSALIHAATMVAAGAYVVALLYPVFLLAPAGMAVLAVLAAISMLGAALAALAVDDLKRALAYSTISQLGFVLAVLAVGGRQEGVAHLLAHGAFKALLFLGSGVVLLAAGSTTLARLGGLRRAMPVTFVTMTVGFAALAGVPPTSGFFSKDAILTTLIDTARAGDPVAIFVLACALPTVAITAAYATRVWLRTFFGPPGIAVTPPGLVWPLVFLAIPALLLGVAVVWLGALRSDALSTELSVSLVAVGIAASWLAWRRAPRTSGLRTFLARAGYTDDLYERTVVPVVMRLARGVVHVDDHGVERAVIGVGRSARRLGGALRLIQNGNVQAYATGLFFGVLVLAFGVVVLR